jgi:hypothetical protein
LVSPPTIERENWFNPVDQLPPVSNSESTGIVTPRAVDASRSSQARSRAEVQASTTPAEDPPLLLKLSISADSDEDSFYYHIRGKPASKSDSPSRSKSGSSFKSKSHKNPYAFSNHPLLPAVVEEGNIAPFPTTFDELDSEDEPASCADEPRIMPKDSEETAGQALGSFAASIGKVEPSLNQTRLQMYKSPIQSGRRRRRSFWQIFAPCFTRTRAEV